MISNPNALIIVAYPLCFFVTFASQRLGFNGNGKGGVGRGLFALRLSQFETKNCSNISKLIKSGRSVRRLLSEKETIAYIALPPEVQ